MKKIIALAIIAGCVWLMNRYPYTMLNPGELVEGHMKIKKDCSSCHNPFWGVPSKKCINCHALSEIGEDSVSADAPDSFNNGRTPFHKSLGKQECTSCHTDHIGVNPDMPISQFSHDVLSQTETANCTICHGRQQDDLHKKLTPDCNSCHRTADWSSVRHFDHNMIQDTTENNCRSCHQVPSDSFHRQSTRNCGHCHTDDEWIPSSFDHQEYFRFDKHHNNTCESCHTSDDYMEYTCYNCHEHTPGRIRGEHNEHGIFTFDNCAECHRSGDEDEAERIWKSKRRLNKKGMKRVSGYKKDSKDDDEHEERHKKKHDDDDDDDD